MPLTLPVAVSPFLLAQVIVRREHGNACYSAGAYFTAKVLFLIAVKGATSLYMAAIIFFMSGIHPRPLTPENFFIFAVAVFVLVLWSTVVGFAIGAGKRLLLSVLWWFLNSDDPATRLTGGACLRAVPLRAGIMLPNIEAAGALALPFLLVQILFSGFYLSKGAIPPWFIWACAPAAAGPRLLLE